MAYSEQQIGEAVAVLDANEGNVSHTRRQLKNAGWDPVPARPTLDRWAEKVANEATSVRDLHIHKRAAQKKVELAGTLERLAIALAGDLIDEGRRSGAKYRDLATTLGISIDKLQLLRQQPTSISEQRQGEARENLFDTLERKMSAN